jgi:hypothetical protein
MDSLSAVKHAMMAIRETEMGARLHAKFKNIFSVAMQANHRSVS